MLHFYFCGALLKGFKVSYPIVILSEDDDTFSFCGVLFDISIGF